MALLKFLVSVIDKLQLEGQLHSQDMIYSQEVKDPTEFVSFTENVPFTVRRTVKAWSGIWQDITIEQTLLPILKTGAQPDTDGRSLKGSVLTLFIKGTSYAFDKMDRQPFANCRCTSSEQHINLPSVRQKKDVDDAELFRNWLQEHGIFDGRPGKIKASSTGLVGNSTIECHKAVEKSSRKMSEMVGLNADSWKFSRKSCVKTLRIISLPLSSSMSQLLQFL